MEEDSFESIWVSIEYLRGTSTNSMRGKILEQDFKDIIKGTFSKKFVELNHIHWTQTVSMHDGKTGIKFISYGKDGQWKWNTGQFFLEVSQIISLAVLKDMQNILVSEYDHIYESNL